MIRGSIDTPHIDLGCLLLAHGEDLVRHGGPCDNDKGVLASIVVVAAC
jgi:hypothetical protein